jgi:hypothetical protein
MDIRDQTSVANETVIKIRNMRTEIQERLEKTDDEAIHQTANELLGTMKEVEEDLYQVKNRSGQDPLNFPIKLNNRFASLRRSVETGDAKPTNGAYKVFEELSEELDGHLAKLNQAMTTKLPALNSQLAAKGLSQVSDD